MSELWVVDTKCSLVPDSLILQDGCEFYYGRSLVPASSKENAIKILADYLQGENISLMKALNVIRYEDGFWDNEDDYNVKESNDCILESNGIELGCFVSEKSRKGVSPNNS